MESPGLYLLKSAVWLTGFALVFLTVLRNERYFRLNRIYLLSGIVASTLFPLYTWHYAVILPSGPAIEIGIPEISAMAVIPDATSVPVYWWFYVVGIAYFASRLIWQTGMVVRKLRKTGYVADGPVKLVLTSEYEASFSFFSFVFVNPSTSDLETKEIVNHESEHIRQRHWFDLLLVELLCMLQWFNPFVWIYAHLIRQNHEYLADEKALQRTSNPAIYQATLLNQLFGGPVINLANSFSYSLNKKRFKMMKKNRQSPFRKLKLLLILPLMALVFYAFAKPEYISAEPATSTAKITTIAEALNELDTPLNLPVNKTDKVVQSEQDKIVKGSVVNADGKPLPGTSVIIVGTHVGTITDNEGNFVLKDVAKEAELMFTYVGYQTVQTKSDSKNPMVIKMAVASIGIDKVVVVGYGKTEDLKTPPSPLGYNIRIKDSKNPPLFIIAGSILPESVFKALNPETFQSVNVLKGESATAKYGDQAKNGAVEVTLKSGTRGWIYDDSVPGQSLAIKTKTFNLGPESKGDPLTILDGVIIDKAKMGLINPNNIESISVLKDKSATALYGEKGKDGVILITSKGKAGLSEPQMEQMSFTPGQGINKSLVYTVVEQMPEFPGGKDAMIKFISTNIVYPIKATAEHVSGKVIVNFIVSNTGKVERAKVLRSVHPALDAEALRVIGLMPDWTPGKQNGQSVSVSYTLPIDFMLQSKEKKTAGTEGSVQAKQTDGQPFIIVEQMPQFPGGEQEMMKFISENIKYPPTAKEKGVTGTVIVNFIVNKEGKIIHIKVVRGIGAGCDEEAIRIFGMMPDWSPGMQGGKAVNVSYTVPIKFALK